MFRLKQYQQRCLDELAEYFRRIIAFQGVTEVPEKLAFEEKEGRAPYQQVRELPGLPYVCLRVPTGGGKTVLASHAVGVACNEYLRIERCLVFWLAPTTQIVRQTINALQDKRHPYRQALDATFGGRVTIMDLSAAVTSLKPGDLSADTVVIVSTIQAPRVGDREGRKVYTDDNGHLMDHFESLKPGQMEVLDKTEAGKPAYSLANVFKLHRPVVIVDEAHNARTDLSFETLARFNPSCIVEFTATPADDSNVLTSVSASELKAEEMIKLPVRLHTRPQWKEAIQEALAMQAKLETLAGAEEKTSGEYIRPIVLFQAQRRGDSNITFGVLKQSLLDDFGVPDEQIAVATGGTNDLERVDVLARDCDVRFIITVDRLREGWDCPFAYVLCSVSNLTSRTAVEQVMGRVLRMPHAHRKQHGDLNHAYAFVTSQGFVDAANALTDALIDSGFDPYEARASVKPQTDKPLLPDMPLWSPVAEVLSVPPTTEAIPEKLREHVETAPAKLAIDTGAAELTATLVRYTGAAISHEDENAWKGALASEEEKKAVERLARKSRAEDAWPAAMGQRLAVPVLAVRTERQLELFEDQFCEGFWRLSECDSLLTEAEFRLDAGPQTGAEIDVEEGRIGWRTFTDNLHRQLSFLDAHGPKTEAELGIWLDGAIAHPDVTQLEASLYMRKVIGDAMTQRGLSLEQLVANRFRLRDAVAQKIRGLRNSVAKTAYAQMLLSDCGTPLEVTPELCFTFPLNQYPAPTVYGGPIHFNKHYYEIPAAMNKEEAACAVFIDSLPEVEFWVRNLERDQYAFWLQTPTDKFYPDFVAKLTDGRFLVVEYKGAHIETSRDTEEKDAIGQLWQARSKGLCLFRLATKDNMREEIIGAVRRPHGPRWPQGQRMGGVEGQAGPDAGRTEAPGGRRRGRYSGRGRPLKNPAEEFVAELCSRSFLALWSYPNPQRKGGEELCDFLVVCHPDVIVFSVKDNAFKDTGRPHVDLGRWQRSAVEKSVKQVYGAERQLGLVDRVTTSAGRAGLTLPDKGVRRVHRVAVALGGENKVPVSSRDYGRGYVHVFDGPAFGTILEELDTITDFVRYLGAKEALQARLVIQGGEEDLLAIYLADKKRFSADQDDIIVGPRLWRQFCACTAYQAKKEDDRVSYVWDNIIDIVGRDGLDGRLLGTPSLDETEKALRVMAREDRFSRRGLGKSFAKFLEANQAGESRSRITINAGHGLATYVFLGCPLGTPRELRRKELALRCFVARGLHPENETVVGIATETPRGEPGFSFDLVHRRTPEWTAKDASDAQGIQDDLGFFANMRIRREPQDEYPQQGPCSPPLSQP